MFGDRDVRHEQEQCVQHGCIWELDVLGGEM
jgi:hypothetical protein